MRSIIILLGLLLLLWMGWWQIDDSTLGERARDADTAVVLQRGNGPEPETLMISSSINEALALGMHNAVVCGE